ncbi:MAG: methionine--tRNA ligase subunit beta [Planctomycetes bacterium]|nr:methionine--tRNA ligase subunit beta [Planctomycetota bacterium]
MAEEGVASAAVPGAAPAQRPAEISIEEFARVDLRTAKVVAARAHESADRLMVLTIDLGGEPRQLVAGIRKHRTPESMVGRTIVVVANLKPARLRGIESQGMLLAVSDGEDLALVTVDKEARPGLRIK